MMEPTPSRHRYEVRGIYGDYARTATGLALTLGPLLATGATGVAAGVLYALAGLFALFGLRTYLRHHAEVTVDAVGVSTTGMRRVTVPWNDLRRVKLSYFSTRRDRQRGWMQLNLRGGSGVIRVDSQLEGFDALVAHTAEAVNAGGLLVSDTTAANFAAYGHAVPAKGLLGEGEGESGRRE